ncbi:MAG: hypothetical protein QM767_25840 [Anaeromyxobacter sp.]
MKRDVCRRLDFLEFQRSTFFSTDVENVRRARAGGVSWMVFGALGPEPDVASRCAEGLREHWRIVRRSWIVRAVVDLRFPAVLGLLLGAGVAHAAAPARPDARGGAPSAPPIVVSLDFNADEGCADRARFESGLKARFDRISFAGPGASRWILQVRLTTVPGGAHGELRFIDEHGEASPRVVDGADCASVVEALSLTAALAIEQTVALAELTGSSIEPSGGSDGSGAGIGANGAPPKNPDGSAPSDVPTTPQNPSAPDPETDPFRIRSHRFGVSFFAAKLVSPQTSIGMRGEYAFAPRVSAAIRPELGIGLSYVPAESLQPKSPISVSETGAFVLLCPTRWFLGEQVSLLPCASTTVGHLRVSSREVWLSTPSERWQATSGIDARLETRLGRHISLDVLAGLFVPWARRSYRTIEPNASVGETPHVSWILGVGWNWNS